MNLSPLLKGVAIGAAVMYFVDPKLGKRRQRDAVERLNAFAKGRQQELDLMAKDFSNRAQIVVCEVQGRANNIDPGDSMLERRVRGAIAKVVTNAGAIDVLAHRGMVTLEGKALKSEIDELVAVVLQVPGVNDVHTTIEGADVAPLGKRAAPALNPAESLVAVGAGALLLAAGFLRGGASGPLFKAVGIGLAFKGFSDTEKRIARIQATPPKPAKRTRPRKTKAATR